MPPLLNIREAADYLGISPHTLYKLVERREVPAAKIGGSWRLNRAALDNFVAARSAVARPSVLIIEPSEREREALAAYARPRADTVATAACPDEGLSMALQHRPDIVFLAAPLPGAHSVRDVLSELQAKGVAARVALMVRPRDAHAVAAALALAPVILLRKPVERADVASILTLITR